MSKIDDSDNQRIREMQETELRNRVDQQKKDGEQRITKSFSDVMKDKASKEQGDKLGKMVAGKELEKKKAEEKGVLSSLLKKSPKESAELSRRAALSRAMQGGMTKTRAKNADDANRAQSSRVDDMSTKSRDEKEVVDKDVREHDDMDARRDDEKEVEQKLVTADQNARMGGEVERTDRDGQRRNRGGDRGKDDDQPRTNAVQATDQPRAAHVPRISQELIDQIVSAIHSAHAADGRTEMHVDLKGSMLEGIRLKVRSEGGKVRCTFEGCDRDMRALLEASKGALMRGLSKKGMSLVAMDVK